MSDKAQLRRQMMEQRRGTPLEQRRDIDRAICAAVLRHARYQSCRTLFVYYSTAEEVGTHGIIADALRCGKRVCLPKCLPGHLMQPRRIVSERDLTEQSFGIPEPGAHCTAVSPQDIDLCIVPALACDRRGARLGYGGGFYDRFLSQTPAYRIALCAQARVLPQLPTQPHDIRCDCVLTEQEVMLIHEG